MKLQPTAALLAASAIAILTLASVQSAFATSTVPNAVRRTFDIPGSSSGPIVALPTSSAPVDVLIGTLYPISTTAAFTMLYERLPVSGFKFRLTMTGQTSYSGGIHKSYSSGTTDTPFIAPLTPSGQNLFIYVGIDSSGNPTGFYVYNQRTSVAKVVITQIW